MPSTDHPHPPASYAVVDYDPRWSAQFAQLREAIQPVLRGIATDIEHVGSTSVPGLPAKPIIDLSVVVPDAAGVQAAIQALATLGYSHRGDLGIEGREAFFAPERLPLPESNAQQAVSPSDTAATSDSVLANPASTDLASSDSARPSYAPPAHNLYVCPAGSLGLRNHLLFRDYLRSHPDRAAEYAALKRTLAAQFLTAPPDHRPEWQPDVEAYVAGKTEFVVGVLAHLGLEREGVDSVRRSNTGAP